MLQGRMHPLDVRTAAPGVRRFTVPLTFDSPDHLHVHVLDTPEGPVVVDTGAKGSEAALAEGVRALGVASPRVLVTHGHIDHWGLATTLSDRVLAHRGIGTALRFAAGEPPPPGFERMQSAFAAFANLSSGIPELDPLEDGDRVGDWEVLYTPGHDPGHVCLWRASDGVLVCGDLLLPGYTPNIQPTLDDGDALADFIASLRRVARLPVTLVLPAHGEPYADAAGRAAELIGHHDRRLDVLREHLADGPQTLSALRRAAFGAHHTTPADKMLAAMETYAHLDHLRRARQEAEMLADGSWRLVA